MSQELEPIKGRGWILAAGIMLILAGLIMVGIPRNARFSSRADRNVTTSVPAVTSTEWGAWVRLKGNEGRGVNSGVVLGPGEKARVSWEGGRITYRKPNGEYNSYPIWGAPSYNPRYRDEFRFSNRPGIPAAGVLVLLGTVESPEKVMAFPEGYISILVKNTEKDPLPVVLYYHDMIWDYQENGGDGSYAVFKVYKF
jgi:hypothetical protein